MLSMDELISVYIRLCAIGMNVQRAKKFDFYLQTTTMECL
jgi:hypothetical protein